MSPYPPMIHLPQHAEENPTVLTIRKIEAADVNRCRSLFGEKACSGSLCTESLMFGNTESAARAKADSGANAENVGFLKVDSFTFRASAEKSLLWEDNKAEPGDRGEKSCVHQAEDVDAEAKWGNSKQGFGPGGYGAGSSVGGKLRSLRRGSKRTPYDRPATGRHATAGGSAAIAAASPSPKLTVVSRLRESTSRFLHSSASFVFSALFKKVPPAIKAVEKSEQTAGVGIVIKEGIRKETCKTTFKQIDLTSGPGPASQAPELVNAGVNPMDTEGRVLDIVQIEEILKHRTWSREQVNRLTKVLQTHVSENDAANFIVEEAEKIEMQLKPEVKDSSPVQVARAYMGELATRPSGIAATIRKSSLLSTKVQSSPVHTLESMYLPSPFSRNWAQSSPAVRVPKRSLAREDDMSLMGHMRRVRQKTSMPTNGSPYTWRITGLRKPSEMQPSSPPSQSTQTALKILETLEKLSPSPQGKVLDVSPEKSTGGPMALQKFSPFSKGKFPSEMMGTAGISTGEQTPETSKARENLLAQNLSSDPSPKVTELNSIDKTTFRGTIAIASEPVKMSKVEAPSAISESYHRMPVLGKGFQMNALFEESNSDDEAKVQAKQLALTESRGGSAPHSLKEEATAACDAFVASCDPPDFSRSSLLDPVQSLTPSALMLKSCSMPAPFALPDKHGPSVAAISRESVAAFPICSLPSMAAETSSILSHEPTSSPSVAAEVKLSVERVLRVPNLRGVKSLSPSSSARQIESSATPTASMPTAAFLSTSSEFTTTTVPFLASDCTTVSAALGIAATDAINVFLAPTPVTSKTGMGIPEDENTVTMMTESPVADKLVEVDTMATDIMADEADTSIVAQPASSVPSFLSNADVQPSTESTFTFVETSSSAGTFSFGAGLGSFSSGASSSFSASLFAFGSQSSTASAGQASNSLFGGFGSSPSAAFAFGGQLKGQVPTFSMGVSASSSSATFFTSGKQSGTMLVGQAPSFVGKPPGLYDQSGTASNGQAPAFGALSSSPGNPFSSTAGNSGFPSLFGLSSGTVLASSSASVFGAVSSTSSVLISSSSELSSFSGASSTFQFGASVEPIPSMPTPSLSSNTANLFTPSPFLSSSTPTLSTTPTFCFGSSSASSSLATSALTGSIFTFSAAQSNPFSANTFSSSATQNPFTTFNVGAPAMATNPSSFSVSGSSTSMFTSTAAAISSSILPFGSNSNPSANLPFAFGSGQPATIQAPTPAPFPAAVSTASGQPYGFGGGQPAAPALNPFSTAGAAQSGSESTGGFSVGATSGDKSGRKYIKAKRIGGTKRK